MNKINASAILNHAMSTQQSSPVPARPAMASHNLTPLTPPGRKLSDAGQSAVPQWRLALFDRAFEQCQQKLAERRHADSPVNVQMSGGLSTAELRECDAAAQWVSACLMSSGMR